MNNSDEQLAYVQSDSAFRATSQQRPSRRVGTSSRSGYELHLRLLIIALFLPEGLSFFIGDFRLSLARTLLIMLSIAATLRFFQRVNSPSLVLIPSDLIAMAAGIWMILAGMLTDGFMVGLKGGGVSALEFTGAYCVFRHLLGPVDSSVRVIKFSCKLIIVVVGIALLDPLTG